MSATWKMTDKGGTNKINFSSVISVIQYQKTYITTIQQSVNFVRSLYLILQCGRAIGSFITVKKI